MGKSSEKAPFTRDELKDALEDNVSGQFKRFSVVARHRSHHAKLYAFCLTKKKHDKHKKYILAKEFVHPLDTCNDESLPEEVAYLMDKDPAKQFGLERDSLKSIEQLVGKDVLVPVYRGSLSRGERRVLFRDYLRGPTHGELLRQVANAIRRDEKDAPAMRLHKKLLLSLGVRNGARFEGLCNAQRSLVDSYNQPLAIESLEIISTKLSII